MTSTPRRWRGPLVAYLLSACGLTFLFWGAALRHGNVRLRKGNENRAVDQVKRLARRVETARAAGRPVAEDLKRWAGGGPGRSAAYVSVPPRPGGGPTSPMLLCHSHSAMRPGKLAEAGTDPATRRQAKVVFDFAVETFRSTKPVVRWFSTPSAPERVGGALKLPPMKFWIYLPHPITRHPITRELTL